jgi:OOP family OmpA-OmpF porin
MKKILPLSLLTLLGFAHLHAQIRLGALGGIHSANVLETNNIPGWDSTTKRYESSHSGFQLGVILDIPLGNKGFFFQPALLYTTKGRKYAKNNDSATSATTDTVYSKQSLDLGYVDIPLNLTYKFLLSANERHKNSFFISAGPYVSFFYKGTLASQRLTLSDPKYLSGTDRLSVGKGADTYKTADLGINERVGFEFGNVLLSAYASQGLTSFYNAPYTGTFHHKLFGASLGIWLTSTEAPPPPVKDIDKDGIPDDQDLCPTKPGTAKWHGCPVPDTDHDGIDDEHDSCRTEAGVARYNGCPIPDSDHDGINDEEDKCPTQPGVARYQGCPIPDRDGDGVNDEEDKCPDEAGPAENHGCPIPPEIKKEVTEQIDYTAKNILFALGSNRLAPSSLTPLADLAALLVAHPEWQLTIEGYTDNEGSPGQNQALSQQRADAVKNFLVKKGVQADRLIATGHGKDHPIADNATTAGRSANRRVELKLSIAKK